MLPHKNRTLVLGSTPKPTTSDSDSVNSSTTSLADLNAATENYVSTRGPGRNQLMSKDTYDREQKQKLGQIQRSGAARRQKLDRQERSRLTQHISTQGSREILVDGIRFQLREDGSKLLRVTGKQETLLGGIELKNGILSKVDAATAAKDTPKKIKIASVDFIRTKNGNLVRANAVKGISTRLHHQKQRPQCEHFTKHGTTLPFQPWHGCSP